jgi:hypothetical protein
LTARVSAEVVDAVKTTGCLPVRAAERAGVARRTFYEWVKAAKRAEARTSRSWSQYERTCVEFSHQIDRVLACYSTDAQAVIARTIAGRREGANGELLPLDDPALQLRAATWWLEKRTEQFGNKAKVDVSGHERRRRRLRRHGS